MNQAPELMRVVCRLEAHGEVLVDELEHHGDDWHSTAGRLPRDGSTPWEPG